MRAITLKAAVWWAAGAVVSFHLAYSSPKLSFLIVGYLFGLLQLARAQTGRQAFYFGLAVGVLTAAPQLSCFWAIFGPSAIALWLVVAFWVGLFVALARMCLVRFGPRWGVLLIPFLWTGLEYFRSELYYLRFSWLNVGYAFSGSAVLPALNWLGMYGAGFLAMAAAVAISRLPPKNGAVFAGLLALAFLLANGRAPAGKPEQPPGKSIQVAGVQLEFAPEAEVANALDRLVQAQPEAELLVLSEYTFDGPVPDKVTAWCREHRRYLIVGGKDPAPKDNFYDTAYVVGPAGEITFRQVKSVPIQFFKDGLPAPEQKLWDSPWGKMGLCVCYDLSYTRVTDALIRLGAQAIIVPTMDVMDWGRREHELHALVAPVRAAEYGVPIFRVASSGISQLVDRSGQVLASAGVAGQQETLGGRLTLGAAGTFPFDRWLAPCAMAVTALIAGWLLLRAALSLSPSDGERAGVRGGSAGTDATRK